jgi:hypothetical protein
MSHGGDTQYPATLIADMEDPQPGVHHEEFAVPSPQPDEPAMALTEDVDHLERVWSLKRQRTASPGDQGIYLSLPTSPNAFHATTTIAHSDESEIPTADGVSFFVPVVGNEDFESLTGTSDVVDRHQRAHSQPTAFEHGVAEETGPPQKKRRLFQHEHLLDISETGGDAQLTAESGQEPMGLQEDTQQHGEDDVTAQLQEAEHQDGDDITAQLMASLQQAAEETEFPQADAAELPAPEITEHTEPEVAEPLQPEVTEPLQPEPTELLQPEQSTDLAEPEPMASSPKDITLASVAAEVQSPSAIVIDPALNRPVPNPVIRTSHPLSAAPVPVIIGKPSNSRPVPTNPLNGLSRSSSAALTSRSPSATGPRPVIPSPYHPVNRPAAPKKPSRDFTPARLTDKRRPTPRRTGARGLSTDPYQPPTASSLGYQPARNSNNVDDPNLAAGLSPETLSVLEAAATTLSQIQGPITQEHLEGIVCEWSC